MLVDARTGDKLEVGDVVSSLDRGDLLEITAIEPNDMLDCMNVRLRPISKEFTVFAHWGGRRGGLHHAPILEGLATLTYTTTN